MVRGRVGNQLPILLISFRSRFHCLASCWESVTNPLDKLSRGYMTITAAVGNQLPILLISFALALSKPPVCWESVTNPLDKLSLLRAARSHLLGISYQSS